MKLRANGVEINYALAGPAGAPVVTLSHSIGADLTMWDPTLPALTERYRVLRYDLRGHGGSEAAPGAYSLEQLAEDARALLGALGIARTHWVGLSLGGMIGQALALRAPETLAGLVLCDTACGMPPEMKPVWNDRIAMAEGKGGTLPGSPPPAEGKGDAGGAGARLDDVLARWFTPGFVQVRPDVVAATLAMIARTSPRGFAGCAAAIRDLDFTERLSGIRLPTLLIVGEQDEATPPIASRLMQALIKDAELVVLPGAAHLSNVEQPEAFNRALAAFLARIDTA